MNNKAKWVFAASTALAPIQAEAAMKGTACPEMLVNTAAESTLTLLSENPNVSIQLNGGELALSTIHFTDEQITIAKGLESTEIALDTSSGFAQVYAENVIGEGIGCSATFTNFAGEELMLICGNTTVALNEKEVFAQFKDSPFRHAEKWCESSLALQAPTP